MASRTGASRQIMSSKRARGAQKKSKKLQALEQQQKEAASKLDVTPIVPSFTVVNRTLQPIVKAKHTTTEQPLEDHDKTDEDDDDEDDNDLILIPRPVEVCARFAQKSTWTKDDIASNATFSLSIPSFHESTNESGAQHVVYAVVLETPHHTFTVKKRYSEFDAFSSALQLKDIVWELPPKTWFRLTQESALSDRRERLESACVNLFLQRPHLALDPLVRDFFQLDLFALSVAPPLP